jgi:hypothetical protein
MFTRTLAASVLALGLLSPVVASAQSDYACSQVNNQRADYGDCDAVTTNVASAALAAPSVTNGPKASIGDFIDETTVEKNQRSSN